MDDATRELRAPALEDLREVFVCVAIMEVDRLLRPRRDLELRYFRDTDGREVDFVVTENGRPILLVEVKWSAGPVDPSLRYLKLRYPSADAWQIHMQGEKDFVSPDGVRVAPALELLKSLV